MTIKVYDYDNKAKEINLPDKKIISIYVHILSGDETGMIVFEDGDVITFDASDFRLVGYDDGSYVVNGDKIEEWINFQPTGGTVSYKRQEIFW